MKDQLLVEIVDELVRKHRCHTVILYGSRARGDFTSQSDYDVMGVRATGKKFHIAEKRRGFYLDLFVFQEKDLRRHGEDHLYMAGGKVLYERGKFGTNFLRKVRVAFKKKYVPLPANELAAGRVWLHKMYERATRRDIEGNYRRSWLHEALLSSYFQLRKKRFLGSKKSFEWLKKNDVATYRLFERVLAKSSDLKLLKKLVERVSGAKLK